jgi:hypothetical protein
MKTLHTTLLACLAWIGISLPVSGFSLLGPFTSWQTAAIGYDLNITTGVAESGGPMNLGEEYRLNVPELTYGFDASFLNYFGTKGVAAIDEAFAVLNALPTADQIDLNSFPLQAKGPINFTALNLNMLDLKSHVLGIMLAQFGVGNPERYTWCLRAREPQTATAFTNYLVIQRNFDPSTFLYTNVINGTIYTYTVFDPITVGGATYADAVERPVDPAADDFTTLAGIENPDPLRGINLNNGEYFTGLTKDDAAALRYLYRSDNYNIEDVTAGINLSTNPVNGSPFVTPGTSNVLATNTLMGLALRPGIGFVRFTKLQFDSIVGTTLSYTNDYVDRYITNNVVQSQRLERSLTVPDILFVADDLGTLGDATPVRIDRTGTTAWVDHSGDNTVGAIGLGGPGVISPTMVISYSKLGPSRLNASPFFLDENTSTLNPIFGHFDTRTIFAVFPDGNSIQAVEALVGTDPAGTGESPFQITP